MMPNQPITLEDWYRSTNLPATEKRGFLCHFLGLTQIQAMTERNYPLTEIQIKTLTEAVNRRLSGEPFPYIVGTQEFFSRAFHVDSSVLIPRPDTECLVEWLIDNIPQNSKVADLGTGSGCIAITLKLERPDLKVAATDISSDAVVVARKNARDLNADIHFFQGSWLEALPSQENFDVIVSNPPYIERNDKHLQHLSFEPLLALTDNKNGLSCIEAIYQQSSNLPVQPSIIALEHGWDQGTAVRQLAEKYGFFNGKTFKDYGGNDRFTVWKKR